MDNPNRLNILNEDVEEIIEEKYEEKKEDAEIKTIKAVNELREKITRYRSMSTIDMALEAERNATSEYDKIFENVKDADDLKTAIYTALLDIRGQVEISDTSSKAIDDIISGLSKEQEKSMIQWYKEKVKKELISIKTEKMKKEYILFKLMSDEEVEEYIAKYKRTYEAGELLKARRSSIHSAARECHADDPICIAYEDTVDEKATKIVKREKQDIKDYSIKKRIKQKMQDVIYTIEEHAPNFARALIGSNCFGFFLGTILRSKEVGMDAPEAVAAYLASSAIVFAICSAVICKKEIRELTNDQRIISEAKDVGLYDLALEYSRACSEMTTFEKEIRHSARKQEAGRVM